MDLGGKEIFDVLNWMWGILAVPLGWLWKRTSENQKEIKNMEKEMARMQLYNANTYLKEKDLEKITQPLKEQIFEVSTDIKEVKKFLLESYINFHKNN